MQNNLFLALVRTLMYQCINPVFIEFTASTFTDFHFEIKFLILLFKSLFTPPSRRAWRSYKFASLKFSVSVSQTGLPLMGDTAVRCCLSPCHRNF